MAGGPQIIRAKAQSGIKVVFIELQEMAVCQVAPAGSLSGESGAKPQFVRLGELCQRPKAEAVCIFGPIVMQQPPHSFQKP